MTFHFGFETFLCVYRKGLYFRIRGKGLSFEVNRRHSFSERYGYKKVCRIGPLAVEVLR